MNSSKILDSSRISETVKVTNLDLDKIRDTICLLEEHEVKCGKAGRFVEAEIAKQRIAQLKQLEEEKLKQEQMNQYEERRKLLESEQKLEFDMFNESWDEKFYEMNTKFEEMQKNLKEQHEKELSEEINKFNETYPQHPKPTPEILQLNKSLEVLANMRDYQNAHLVQCKLADLTDLEMKKFEEEKARGLQSFIDKVQMKQDAEQSALHQKMQSNYGTFKRERALQFEQMVLKYKNKTKEFEDRLKHDTKNFSRILKGTHKPKLKQNNITMSNISSNNAK